MIIIHVHAHIKPDNVDAFKEATIENAGNSVKEPGILRFDIIQQEDDPTRFILVEVYKDTDAVAQYIIWDLTDSDSRNYRALIIAFVRHLNHS